jgi:hypothetical protein
MSDEILDDCQLTDENTPRDLQQVFAVALEDLGAGNPPDALASEIIQDFILIERDETPQLLALIDAPTENIVEMLKELISYGYEAQMAALDTKGAAFVEGLKFAVKTQLTELANDTARLEQ